MGVTWSMAWSVPGQPQRACEDASAVSARGDAVVLADGLGSARRGAEAARLAVAVGLGPVRDAVLAGLPAQAIPEVLAAVWRERTGDDRDLSTTMLMAIRGPAYTVVGQLGDGLALIFDPEASALRSGRGAFGNETACLPRDRMHVYVAGPTATVFLATDGVADDLVAGRQPALVERLLETRRAGGAQALDAAVTRWLQSWRTPSSRDDRSVGLLSMEKT